VSATPAGPITPATEIGPAVPTDERPSPTDVAHFREVLGHVPTAVTVITGLDGDHPVGMAVGSFSSISLEPTLVGFFVARTSSSWPRIRRGGAFCANVLGADQESVCRAFARSGGDKFRDVAWTRSPHGLPVIEGAVAWVDCVIDRVDDAGDHELCIGRVRELAIATDGSGGSGSLVFYRGGYGTIAGLDSLRFENTAPSDDRSV
jgi:3-hydroxy-9,10-secoandrosta-1,3,5(10)-triene-9,17-dione monooxygenase reductase component